MPDVSGAHLAVPSTLEGAGPYINGVAFELEERLATLRSQILATTELWDGATKRQYIPLQNRWDTSAEGLFSPEYGVLGQIAQTMNLNWNNYVECEHTNTRSMAH